VTYGNTTFHPPHWLFYRFFRVLFRLYFQCFGGVRVVGWERVPQQGPLLLAATHKSLADPWLMLVASRRPFRSLAARDLFSIWWLGWFLKGMAAFPVTRGTQDAKAISEARRWLEQGAVVLVFPEGRCSPGEELLPIQPGVALLAVRSRVPVVPVVLRGDRQLLPLDARWPRRQVVEVEFGLPLLPPAIPTAGAVRQTVESFREQLQNELQLLYSEGNSFCAEPWAR